MVLCHGMSVLNVCADGIVQCTIKDTLCLRKRIRTYSNDCVGELVKLLGVSETFVVVCAACGA